MESDDGIVDLNAARAQIELHRQRVKRKSAALDKFEKLDRAVQWLREFGDSLTFGMAVEWENSGPNPAYAADAVARSGLGAMQTFLMQRRSTFVTELINELQAEMALCYMEFREE